MFLSASFYDDPGLAHPLLWAGLGVIIAGTGLFKANIASMVGSLYAPDDRRKDSAFTIFYMGINIGAFLAPLVAGGLGDTGDPADFRWGFLAAAIGMAIGTLVFQILQGQLHRRRRGPRPGPAARRAQGRLTPTPATTSPWSARTGSGSRSSSSSAFFVIFFWAAFEQAGASLTVFADRQTDRDMLGWTMPASWFQSVNAVAIVLFAPVFAWLWQRLGKARAGPQHAGEDVPGLLPAWASATWSSPSA